MVTQPATSMSVLFDAARTARFSTAALVRAPGPG